MSNKPSHTEKQAAIAAAKAEVAQAEAALAAAKHRLAQAEDMGLGSWSKALRNADRELGLR